MQIQFLVNFFYATHAKNPVKSRTQGTRWKWPWLNSVRVERVGSLARKRVYSPLDSAVVRDHLVSILWCTLVISRETRWGVLTQLLGRRGDN